MEASGLPDDPVVIDDQTPDGQESFFVMRRKLAALQMEIQDVIEHEEEKMRREQEQQLSDYCETHHITIRERQGRETANPLKRARADSGPPPLIPIPRNTRGEDDSLGFIQLSMAGGQRQGSKRAKRAGRQGTVWTMSDAEWDMMNYEKTGASRDDNDVEIIEEVIMNKDVKMKEEENYCLNQSIEMSAGCRLQEQAFTKVEIVWPENDAMDVKTGMETNTAAENSVQKSDQATKAWENRGERVKRAVADNNEDNEIEIISEVDMKQKMQVLEKKKRLFAMIHEKANNIIDSTRARAKFQSMVLDVQPINLTGPSELPLKIEAGNVEIQTPSEDEMDKGIVTENAEALKNDGDTIDDMVTCETEVNRVSDKHVEVNNVKGAEIPMELLAEIENLNNMSPENTFESWIETKKKSMKTGGIWKKIGVIFIVTQFFEFLEAKGYHIPRNMVAAC